MDDSLQRALLAASGYLDLGMHREAWDALQDLPPQLRTEDPVLEMQVAIYIRGQKWMQIPQSFESTHSITTARKWISSCPPG